MKEIKEKISSIISALLLYSDKVTCVYKPLFLENALSISIVDSKGIKKQILVNYTKLTKVHDHLLETYIFEMFRENDLL